MSKQPRKTKEQKAAEKAEQQQTTTQAEAEKMVASGEAEIPAEAVVTESEVKPKADEPMEAYFEEALKVTGIVPKDKLARAHYKMFYTLGFQDGAK